jgi:hypothetical protein
MSYTDGKFKTCIRCGKHDLEFKHTCLPEWGVKVAGSEDDYESVYAHDSEEAAEEFAERYDREVHIIPRGDDIFVEVKSSTNELAAVEYFSMRVEGVPTYYGNKIDLTPPTEEQIEEKAKEIYLERYAAIGGKWELVDTKGYWHQLALQRFLGEAA